MVCGEIAVLVCEEITVVSKGDNLTKLWGRNVPSG